MAIRRRWTKVCAKPGTRWGVLTEHEARRDPETQAKMNRKGIEEMVADKGYHSGVVVEWVKSYQVRTCIPEL